MCTVTLVAQQNGYSLGMNRDEKLTRPAGLAPSRKKVNGRDVICPSEPTGGTWIALNDAGVSFALINWYSVTARVKNGAITRGEVVNLVSGTVTSTAADEKLGALDLRRLNPFRLIGVFPATKEIIEWRWNLQQLVRRPCPWQTQQWISSGFDEVMAERFRSSTFSLAETSQHDAGWLRQLHQSHSPVAGPFSICVHRDDAATVSFTEILVRKDMAVMRYTHGSPCQNRELIAPPAPEAILTLFAQERSGISQDKPQKLRERPG